MAQHGYLREYDEGWDRGNDRQRSERNSDDRSPDRDRGFMFGSQGERFRGDEQQLRERSTGGSDWQRPPRNFSSHQDDHYRTWRDRQMQALDRDYEDYCREREQQFHSDFDGWRRNRRQGQKPAHGSTEEEVMELSNRRPDGDFDNGPSPVAEATLGTNNSENTAPGRR